MTSQVLKARDDEQVSNWEAEIATLEQETASQPLAGYDVEQILAFAERVLPRADSLWESRPSDLNADSKRCYSPKA